MSYDNLPAQTKALIAKRFGRTVELQATPKPARQSEKATLEERLTAIEERLDRLER